MDKLVGLITSSPGIRSAQDDDFVDRLSSRYTVAILVAFCLLVSMNQYVRNPITCWAPNHFTGSHTKFTTNYCWVKSTYYLPWASELPKAWEDEKRHMIPYYQWIPFILLAQALMFYVPSIIWHGLNQKAGVDSDTIMAAAHTFARINKTDDQDKTLRMLRNTMDRFLVSKSQSTGCSCSIKSMLSNTCCRVCGTSLGNYLVCLFLFSKICYIANVIGQLFVLNKVLRTKYNTFGVDMISQLIDDQTWTDESFIAFPRVTFCDFQVRGQDVGNTQRYTVQCVLPINLYNEKIYMFLWFWMAFVAAVSVLSFFVWLIRALARTDRIRFIRNHLTMGGSLPARLADREQEQLNKFTDKYLHQDGAFLLRLIAHNCNTITTTEIICSIWEYWNEKNPRPEESSDKVMNEKPYRGLNREDPELQKMV